MLMIKSTIALKTAVTLALAGLAFNASANLMISEVLYDAPNNDSLEEFVELYNASCSSIDLSQYSISDNGASLALSGTLASGQYFTIAKNAAGFNSLFSRQADLAPMPLSLGNSGDYVKLLKGTQDVDVVAWEGGLSGWTLNATNVSVVRSTSTNTKSQADWSVGSNAGNPGVGSLTTSCGTPPAPTENLLENGQAKTSLSASTGQTLKFVADIPAGATGLSFKMSGGSGDADLYVRQGSEPTASVFDCRPYLTGNNEECPIATAVAGRYFVNITAYQGFSATSLVANYTSATSGGGTENPGDYAFDTYYANTNGKTGAALKASLNLIIRDHTRFTYDQVWDGLNYADEDPSNTNNVILLYTNRSEPKTNRAGMSSSLDAWNREHVWAKSHGFPSSGQHAYTDLHHLRPADVTVNSSRGNKDFALGGSPLTEAPDNKTDADSFEPANMVKGDVARMVFYMDVRYEGGDNSGTPNLTVAKGVTGTGEALLGDLCTLLSWHIQDPVSDWERRRNNRVYEWQLNRNPFIDNPMWAEDLYSSSCN
ncbi:endonuclease [Shewanella glacialimarina]|uniref:endonuclease n=1 Tax=Shewanella glacialimarina TaxID=2590884 RepID=UPI00384E7C12